jgi:manganese-transporting P-type ATPase
MIVDFMGCWVIEVTCKYLFADLEPKPMVTKGRERREQRRLIEEQEKAKIQDEEGSKLKVQ